MVRNKPLMDTILRTLTRVFFENFETKTNFKFSIFHQMNENLGTLKKFYTQRQTYAHAHVCIHIHRDKKIPKQYASAPKQSST